MIHSRAQKNRARSSSLFLMELILAILFFSVASAVCVQFFVKSHLLNLDSSALTHAVNECSGAAEILTTADSLTEGLALLQTQYPDMLTEKDGSIQIYYDESFIPCMEASAAYVLDIQLTYSDQMMDIILEVNRSIHSSLDQAVPIYHLETKHHIARRTKSHER